MTQILSLKRVTKPGTHRGLATLRFIAWCYAISLTTGTAHANTMSLENGIKYYNEEQFEPAKHALSDALTFEPTKDQALLYLGRIAFDLGKPKEASSFFLKAVDYPPATSDEYYWLARSYGDQARKAKAVGGLGLAKKLKKYATLAVEENPKSVHARRLLIDYHLIAPFFLGGSKKLAQKNIEQLYNLSAIDADIKNLAFLNSKNKYKEAIIFSRNLAKQYPDSAEALHSAGRTFQSHNLLEEALQCFEQSASLPPTKHNRYYIDKAKYRFSETALWSEVKIDHAIRILTSLIDDNKDNNQFSRDWPIWTLAKLHLLKGDTVNYTRLRDSLNEESLKKDKALRKDLENYLSTHQTTYLKANKRGV